MIGKKGLNKKFHDVKEFYFAMINATLLGLIIQLAGVFPVKALFYIAVLYGITAPIIIGIILNICNNPIIMKEYINKPIYNFLCVFALLLMGISAGFLLWFMM